MIPRGWRARPCNLLAKTGEKSMPLAVIRSNRKEELVAQHEDDRSLIDDEVPFDPWDTDEDESDRRRDPLRQPGARRSLVEVEEETLL